MQARLLNACEEAKRSLATGPQVISSYRMESHLQDSAKAVHIISYQICNANVREWPKHWELS